MGKGPFSFRRTFSWQRLNKSPESSQQPKKGRASPPSHDDSSNNNDNGNSLVVARNAGGDGALAAGGGKGKKKAGGARKWPWMRFDRVGQSELFDCEKSAIVRRVSIPARDLRVLGPVFSHSSNILGALNSQACLLSASYSGCFCAYSFICLWVLFC